MTIQKNIILLIVILAISLSLSFLMIKKTEKSQKQPETPKPIRQPAVAGSFYPADKKELDQQLTVFFKKTEAVKISGKPRILIVPHAGIVYSGQVAVWGFKQIEGRDFKRIILLGGSHQAWFDHVAVDASGFWQTPLGKVEIDEDFTISLIDEDKKIMTDSSPFSAEHSLEIELIFLQKILKNFTIVPILVSNPSDQLIDNLAQKIADNFDEQTLLVVSTDLSHYPTYEAANLADEETINGILSGNKETFVKTIKTVENKNYPGLETAACGHKAIEVALKTAELLKIKDFQKIKYQNSGDVSGDYSRVVGYVSIVAASEKLPTTAFLDEETQKEALEIARKTLEEFLNGGRSLSRPHPERAKRVEGSQAASTITPKNKSLLQPLGAFVTLRNKGQLRGCIGEFEPTEPLYQVIQKMAIAAATRDMRFLPVGPSELKDIKIEISVMTPKRKIDDWRKIKLRKQGVVVQKGLQAGTFLPQVASESGWKLEEFLSHLCAEKAGLPTDCYKDPSVSLYIFDAQVFEE
jgi:AmmeMemoRadiSam system protein B/AmmeMemoRadiSam system protein A